MNTKTTLSLLALALIGGGVWLWQHGSDDPTSNSGSGNVTQSPQETTSAHKPPKEVSQLTNPAVPWTNRIEGLRHLNPQSLAQADIERLFDLLAFQPEPVNTVDWHVVLNEIMFYLCRHNLDPQAIASRFTALANDPAAPEVARDYAIQSLGIWLRPGIGAGEKFAASHPAIKTQIFATLFEIVRNPANRTKSLPGTTLNILGDFLPQSVEGSESDQGLIDAYPDVPPPAEAYKADAPNQQFSKALAERLEPWLNSAITGENLASIPTRTTAIQIAARGRFVDLAPQIRKIAVQTDSSDPLRLSAISALGTLGEPSDRSFLETIAGSNGKFRFAAQSALKRLPSS